MNWVDIILVLFLLKSGLQGFSRGLILSAFKTCGVIVALYMGIFYREAAVEFMNNHLSIDTYLSNALLIPALTQSNELSVINIKGIIDTAIGALGFFLVFLGVQLVFLVPAYFIDGLIKISSLTPINRILGMVFGLGRMALWFALLNAVLSPFLLIFAGSWLDMSLANSYILNHLKFLDFITPIVVKLI